MRPQGAYPSVPLSTIFSSDSQDSLPTFWGIRLIWTTLIQDLGQKFEKWNLMQITFWIFL